MSKPPEEKKHSGRFSPDLRRKQGDVLRELRKERHLTQEQMSELMGICTSAYCKLEYGETQFTDSKISQLAEIFEIAPEALFKYLTTTNYSHMKKTGIEELTNHKHTRMENINTPETESGKQGAQSINFKDCEINGITVTTGVNHLNIYLADNKNNDKDYIKIQTNQL